MGGDQCDVDGSQAEETTNCADEACPTTTTTTTSTSTESTTPSTTSTESTTPITPSTTTTTETTTPTTTTTEPTPAPAVATTTTPECSADHHCASGEVCTDGACGVQTCVNNDECPTNVRCIGGYCGCVTNGGASAGKLCIFPFMYNGITYTTCALENDGYWCSTKVDSNGVHIGNQGNWGTCGSDCNPGSPRNQGL